MPIPNHLIGPVTRTIEQLVGAIGSPSDELDRLCRLDISDFAGRMPSVYWRIVGNAIPVEFHEGIESGERMNWAAVIQICAIFKRYGNGNPVPTDSIGKALRKIGASEVRFRHLLTADREALRIVLADCARQAASMGVAFFA